MGASVLVNGVPVLAVDPSSQRIDASRVSPLVDALRNVGTAPTMWLRLNDLADPPVTNDFDAAVLADARFTHYWELGESSGTEAVNSVSGAANPLTYVNTPTLGVAGPLLGSADTAVTFAAASTEYANAAYAAGLNPANMTVFAWVKTSNTGVSKAIAGTLKSGGLKGGRITITTGNVPVFTFGNSGGARAVTGTTNVCDGHWHLIMGTHDGTTGRLYVDGVQQGTPQVQPLDVNDTAEFRVGLTNDSTSPFEGTIGKVGLANAALTDAEIGDLFVLGRPVIDAMGNHQGGMIGAPVSATGAISGDSDACFDFSGSIDRLFFPYSPDLNETKFTVEAWVYRDTDTGAAERIAHSFSGNNGWGFNISSTDKARLTLGTGAGTSSVDSTTSIAPGAWHHVAATYDLATTTTKIYVNGVLETTSTSVTNTANPSAPLYVGATSTPDTFFNGKIDELTYHGGVVLTAAQIATISAASAPTGQRITVSRPGRVAA